MNLNQKLMIIVKIQTEILCKFVVVVDGGTIQVEKFNLFRLQQSQFVKNESVENDIGFVYTEATTDHQLPKPERIETNEETLKFSSKTFKLNTKFISNRIQTFLKKNQIHKKYFCHKILGTSILLYENLIEKPKEWSKLNSMFKLYFKKMNSFLNNLNEQKSFIDHVKSKENRDSQLDDKNDLIRYDISQIIIDGRQKK